MSKAVVYRGRVEEFKGDEEVTHVTAADGLTEIQHYAFDGCKGLTNLSFLKDSGSTVSRGLASSPCSGLKA
jgi:hypothetical protein